MSAFVAGPYCLVTTTLQYTWRSGIVISLSAKNAFAYLGFVLSQEYQDVLFVFVCLFVFSIKNAIEILMEIVFHL